MRVLAYVIYLLTFAKHGQKDDELFYYVGITTQYVGQSAGQALFARKQWHFLLKVMWLKDALDKTLSISKITVVEKLQDALAEEARLTAQKMDEVGISKVRGGPWVRRFLTHDDHLEREAVLKSAICYINVISRFVSALEEYLNCLILDCVSMVFPNGCA